ncbi:MAG: hypothetical protein H0V89_04010, partial [Deltaproteobacteria bacterium]|nr:hypothetical protein [Deltaproteobacteria bacterium]
IIPNRRRFTAIYEDGWKLIRSSADERELFDRAADPGEHRNLASKLPDRVDRLDAAIEVWLAATPRAPEGPLPEAERRQRREARRAGTDEQAAQLEALGYVQ